MRKVHTSEANMNHTAKKRKRSQITSGVGRSVLLFTRSDQEKDIAKASMPKSTLCDDLIMTLCVSDV